MNTVNIDIEQLQIHHENERIYGETEADQELIDSIRENGLLSRIVVDENNQIVSGARRYLALQHLIDEGKTEFETIEVFQKAFDNEEELVSFIIESNLSREKTWVQKVREGWAIHDSVKKKARYDQFKSLINVEIVPENIPEREEDGNDEKGETYDRVARRVGLSNGKAYLNYSKVLKASNELMVANQKDQGKWLRDLASKSLQSAVDVVKEGKFDLLDADPVKSKENAVEYKKAQKSPPKDSFSIGTWMKEMSELLKKVIKLQREDSLTFNSLREELKNSEGDLIISDEGDKPRITLEIEL